MDLFVIRIRRISKYGVNFCTQCAKVIFKFRPFLINCQINFHIFQFCFTCVEWRREESQRWNGYGRPRIKNPEWNCLFIQKCMFFARKSLSLIVFYHKTKTFMLNLHDYTRLSLVLLVRIEWHRWRLLPVFLDAISWFPRYIFAIHPKTNQFYWKFLNSDGSKPFSILFICISAEYTQIWVSWLTSARRRAPHRPMLYYLPIRLNRYFLIACKTARLLITYAFRWCMCYVRVASQFTRNHANYVKIFYIYVLCVCEC